MVVNGKTASEEVSAYGLNGLLQPEDFLLEEMQGASFSAVAGKGSGAGAVDTVDPVLQFHL